MQKEKKEKEVKKGRHSRVFLSGISLLYVVNQIRKKLPYFTKAQKAGDPRLQPSGMTPLFNCKAFTLIELLVVVLIIGILAAVALPQYQKAVARSRVAELRVAIRQIYDAAKEYKLANSSWPTSWNDMDIQIGTPKTEIENAGRPYEKTVEYIYLQYWKIKASYLSDIEFSSLYGKCSAHINATNESSFWAGGDDCPKYFNYTVTGTNGTQEYRSYYL